VTTTKEASFGIRLDDDVPDPSPVSRFDHESSSFVIVSNPGRSMQHGTQVDLGESTIDHAA